MTIYNAFWELIWPDMILHNLLMVSNHLQKKKKEKHILSIYRILNTSRKYGKMNSDQDHLYNHPIPHLYKRRANKIVRLLLYLNHLQYLVLLLINYLQAMDKPDLSITFYLILLCLHFLGHLHCY